MDGTSKEVIRIWQITTSWSGHTTKSRMQLICDNLAIMIHHLSSSSMALTNSQTDTK